MPFKSRAQQAYLAINKPDVAKKFAMHSSTKGEALPSRVAKPIYGATEGARRSK